MSSRSTTASRSGLRLAYSTVALVLASAVTVVVAPSASALPAGCAYDASSSAVTCTYGSTGAAQSFVVPTGVRAVRVGLTGASGGSSRFGYNPGGLGALVTSTLAVTPGETLQVVVGGVGADGDDFAGGFNGGGGLSEFGGTSRAGGSGGGGSDIRRGAALAGRVLVAAGGGGGGGCASRNPQGCDTYGGSGGAGGVTGVAGGNGKSPTATLNGGGGSGGSDTGGPGGAAANAVANAGPSATSGGDGALGRGGTGGSGAYPGGDGAGGGGGYNGGGGGGGGSVVDPVDGAGGGGGGGGGGSNLVTGSNPVVGTASSGGAGRSTITYTPVPATISATPSTIDRGGSTTLTATGEDVYGPAVFATATPGASCSGNVCTSSVKGTFTVTSTFGGSPGPSTTVTVRNTAPVAVDDSYTAGSGRTLFVSSPGLLANDTDVDGDALIVAGDVDVAGLQGTAAVNADGSFNFTPASGFVGTTSFSYSVSDGSANSARATVNLSVAVPPTVTASPSTITAGGSTTLTATGENIYGPAVFATSTPGTSCSGNVCTATVAGSFTVTSTFGGVAGPSTSVQVTAGAVSAVVGVSGDGQSAVQGATFGAPLVAQVLDAYGNQVGAGVPVTFTLPAASSTSGSATFPGGASTATVVTGANGSATSPVVTAGQSGGVTATATTPAASSGASYLLSVTASGPARADLSVTLSAPSQVTPGGAVTARVTVTNAGPSAASKVVSGLALPRGWVVTNAGGGKVLCKQYVVFTAASLAVKASMTYTVTLTAPKSKGYTFLAAGTSSGTQDPSYRNNITAALVQVK